MVSNAHIIYKYDTCEKQGTLHLFNVRLEDATRQRDELQSSREEEVSHLKQQLERTSTRMGALEGELTEARRTEVKVNEVAKGLREELEKK